MPKVQKFKDSMIRTFELPEGRKQADWFENLFEGRSLILSLSYKGTRSWSVLYYERGKPRRQKLGQFPDMGTKEARKAAREFDVEGALTSAKTGTFKDVAEKWFKRHVEENGLRSAKEIRRHLEYYVNPKWADRQFAEIRRAEVNDLLDYIVDNHGRSQADAVFATIRHLMRWYQARDEAYVCPIVPAMKRDRRKPEEKARDRVLDNEEIRSVWSACDEMGGQFASIIKLCLLTGARREKIAQIKWSDLDLDNGIWTISSEAREKGNAGSLQLPQVAIDILAAQPRLAGNPYVFASGRSRKLKHGFFNAWSKRKALLDEKLSPTMPHWTPHDLRRTCRSLMARVGVLDHVAERVLGHKQAGVQGIYNRHKYLQEMADALGRVAVEIEKILNPENKVIAFPR